MKKVLQLTSRVHGEGSVQFEWQAKHGNILATCGSSNVLQCYNRHGEPLADQMLHGACTSMSWSEDGAMLAVSCDGSSEVVLWDANMKLFSSVETDQQRITFVKWCYNQSDAILVVGNAKGNIVLYNQNTKEKIPVIGKHTKAITCGDCSKFDPNLGGQYGDLNMIALGSEDKTVTVSNMKGETIHEINCKAVPKDVAFGVIKTDELSSLEPCVSLHTSKNLQLIALSEVSTPIELGFQQRYGDIVTYKWFSSGKIAIGFSNGHLVVISTHPSEIGQEIFHSHNHRDCLNNLAISSGLSKLATCGDDNVKVHDLSDLKEVYAILNLNADRGLLDKMQWTEDGQFLAVSTKTGSIYTFLANLPVLGCSQESTVAFLTSLREISVGDTLGTEKPIKFPIEVEPQFLALGPFHVACGMNNRCWFYLLNNGASELVGEKEYMGSVRNISLNGDYACIITDGGKVVLHLIEGEQDDTGERATIQFSADDPEMASGASAEALASGSNVISDAKITSEFVLLSTSSGILKYFYIEDWSYVHDFHHVMGIKRIFPHPSGTKLVFIDERKTGYLLLSGTDELFELKNFSTNVKGILWEVCPEYNSSVFIAYSDENAGTFIHYPDLYTSPQCICIGVTKLPYGYNPVMFYNGVITCLTHSGTTAHVVLSSHELVKDPKLLQPEQYRNALLQNSALLRLNQAFQIVTLMDDNSSCNDLAKHALRNGEIIVAMLCFRLLGDVGMTMSLQKIARIEDKNLFNGHLALIFDDYDTAQELFLQSSQPITALEMRRDLLHWENASQLAKTLAPQEIPNISREYAQQLEFTGDYAKALEMYEKGSQMRNMSSKQEIACLSGLARMSLRTGDISKGIKLATQVKKKILFKECGGILESMKQGVEAAKLYEMGGLYDKAANIYITMRNLDQVGRILSHVKSSKVFGQYGKAKESEGQYEEALKAYKEAKDYDSQIRLLLDNLRRPEEAIFLVKQSQSVEGAKMIAKYFMRSGDNKSAIEFLVLSKNLDEAFNIAQANDQMEHYAHFIETAEASEDEYTSIALYFENRGNNFQAGQFFLKAGQFAKSLNHLLICSAPGASGGMKPEADKALELAIDAVGKAKNESLAHSLIDFLMGDTDGIPKDAKYIFKLYMSLGQFREAARTAVIIAREEQTIGNYKNAHDVLFNMFNQLKSQLIRIPAEMIQNLMILHSYILVKVLVKRGDHLRGARMLIRVANNISKFPAHVVPILTSTVIECQRSGLKNSAFNYAAMLMRPEYRSKIDPKYKKKIEHIVRKPEKVEEDEPTSGCPVCKNSLSVSTLFCPSCKNNLPYCVVTGNHMSYDDWSQCPSCEFPALYSEFKEYLQETGGSNSCPMCSEVIRVDSVKRISDPSAIIKQNLGPIESGEE
eukprot:Nk52_evm6s223 gene=Nk52_evmTU6s223